MFNRLSIGIKVWLIVITAGFGFCLFLAHDYQVAEANNVRLDSIYQVFYPLIDKSKDNLNLLDRMERELTTLVTTGDTESITGIDALSKDLSSNLNDIYQLELQDKKQVDELKKLHQAYYDKARLLSLNWAQASAKQQTMDLTTLPAKKEAFESFKVALQNYRQRSFDGFKNTLFNAQKASQDAARYGLSIFLATATLLIIISYRIITGISSTLGSVIHALEDIARGQGDLTKSINVQSSDELGTLVSLFNSFISQLRQMMREVVSTIGPLSEVSQELKTLTASSAKNFKAQQMGTQEAQKSMLDMTQTVTLISNKAQQASTVALDADAQAREGLKIVAETATHMQHVSAEMLSSQEMVKVLANDAKSVELVVGVINDIAEQTNLLALNASIEAARAGEQGRGFAVVADEVRTLARKTKGSTEEIRAIINKLQAAAQNMVTVMERSSHKAHTALDISASAKGALSQIASLVETIKASNLEIAQATSQQQETTLKTNDVIHEIAKSSEGSVKEIDHVKGVGDKLLQLSTNLKEITAQFKI